MKALSLLFVLWLLVPALAWGADFDQVASEIRQDLARAKAEQKATENELTQKEQDLKAGCCALRVDKLEWALDDFRVAKTLAASGGETAKETGQWLRQVQSQLDTANPS